MFSLNSIIEEVPQLRRGKVWCRYCGCSQQVDASKCFKEGWPKCCGYTMTLDSPEEQKAYADAAPTTTAAEQAPS